MQKSKIIRNTALAGLALAFAVPSFAGQINNCTGGSGDYSDAPASYGVACHDTNKWQQLGANNLPYDISSRPNDYNNDGWTAESSPNAVDAGDNGVFWRTSSDGGATWSAYGQSDALVQGELVQFQMDVARSTFGGHNFDEYKLWLDWYGNGTFSESDVIMNDTWVKNETSDGTLDTSGNGYNNALGTNNSSQTFASFFSNAITVPLTSMLGDVWMRARVACDFSFPGRVGGANFTATGYFHQGEVEDYSLRIVNNVNAPATGLLFSTLAIGLMLRRQRQSL